ncbi:murein biosynthesis integral membrane protein MurJ [Akkermansiaceae bacterium]|nr:murein biosynthesis integral membrane protein MurJ [Akkermansiaceae bacterium]
MLKSLMKVSGFTAISRVLGFLRDIMIARYLGSGLLGDAFFSAFRFPNLFRRVFGEGAFNSAFIPIFGRKLETDGEPEAMKFASNAFSTLLVMLIAVTIVAIPCMHWIMGAVVPGFKPKTELSLVSGGERESFSMNVDGSSNIYLAAPDLGEGYRLENIRFIEEKPLKLPKLIGDGERGESVSIKQATEEYTEKEELKAASEGREPNQALVDFVNNNGSWAVGSSGQAHIRLAKGHDYGWMEGDVVRTASASVDAASDDGLLKMYTNHPDTMELTVTLSRITFCYLLFMALVAHLSGVLNTFKIFGTPAAAPILLNVVFIVGLGVFVGGMKSEVPAHVLAWCVAVAGVLQFAMLFGACRMNGYGISVQKPVFDSSIKKLFLLMGPGILAAGIQQVNLLIGGIIASFQQGAISWLYYSDRVYQLPLGMIGIALGVVLLPEVTRLVRKNDMKGASDSIVRGMELGLLITLPAAIAMLVIPIPMISVLFERGEFTSDDAHQAGMALRGFALGLPGYVLVKVLQPGFFARENTRAPMMMAGVTVLVNIVVSLLLFAPLGHVGIAIATTVSAWVNVILLARGLKGMVHVDKQFWSKATRICISSVVMGGIVWLGYQALGDWFNDAFYKRCIALGLLIGSGMGVYGILVLALKVTSISELKSSFRRG